MMRKYTSSHRLIQRIITLPTSNICSYSSYVTAPQKLFNHSLNNFTHEMKRTHFCGDFINKEYIGKQVRLNAWVENIRIINQRSLMFLLLRDRTGTVQAIVDMKEKNSEKIVQIIHNLNTESVISLKGIVRDRPHDMINKNMQTGYYEIVIQDIFILNESKILPFQLVNAEEEVRLKYRFLDLRRPELLNNLVIRSKALSIVKQYMTEPIRNFLEIETPTLFKSTPEGAREYIVPTRQKGKFYALTQSPQQYKQLLMVGGIDRYFQIARCYRDESGRIDRQPEFTQVDIEMSFITVEDIYDLIEGLLVKLWKEILNVDVPRPFHRMTYNEAMTRFGSDKPDTRFGLEFANLTELFTGHQNITPIRDATCVFAFNAKKMGAQMARKQLIELQQKIASQKLDCRLITIKYPLSGTIAKNLSFTEQEALVKKLDIEADDLVVMCAGRRWDHVLNSLGRIRLTMSRLMQKLSLLNIPEDKYNFMWVVDFPLFEKVLEGQAGLSKGQEGLASMHHPFTAPHPDDIEKLYTDPEKVRGLHYDVVLNGMELGGGSIRIHNPDMQRYVLEHLLQLGKQRTEERFSHLLEALSYGAPPHGGIALGFDRVVSVLCGNNAHSLRDVIAFPKSAAGNELMSGSPSSVEPSQLKELHLSMID